MDDIKFKKNFKFQPILSLLHFENLENLFQISVLKFPDR